MKRAIIIALDAALFASLAAGCATKPAPQPQIKPVLEVRHSGLQPDGYYQLGRFLQEQQRYDDAAIAYRKALALDPKHVDAHNGLGTLYALQGRYAEAHAEFEAALAAAPDNAAVLNNLGYTFLLERKRAEAIAPLEKAARLEPENNRYRANFEIASNNQTPGSAHTPVTAAPATFDAVTAPPQPMESRASKTAPETESARLVAIGPHAFELVMPKPIASKPMLATLPTSHGRLAVEVSNGNGAAGMARRVGKQLQGVGMTVARLTNQVPYGEVTTQVQYRPGHEQAALDLSLRVPGRPPIVASIGLRKDVNVRLVLGRELPADVALVSKTEQVAQGTVTSN